MIRHNLNPDIVSFDLAGLHLQVRWYGLFYVLSFILAWLFYRKLLKFRGIHLSREQYESVIFVMMLGVVLGGRIGYALFYNLPYYFQHPLQLLAVWEGGMSFHGGALGVIIAGYLFVRKNKLSFAAMADAVIPLVSIGLGLGRLGNFINGELWGRPTTLPWGMVFPEAGDLPRHPTQLYELFLEGIVLFAVTFWLLRKIKTPGVVFWIWFALYGIFRFLIEFVREPDDIQIYQDYGYFFGFMSIGQFLSMLMIIVAAIAIWLIYRQPPKTEVHK
ncbi:MAG TPA: prolipoprotein diacylglyceryl transferase [Candidatus Cloacimonadota bacterium]|nr:prolipoprotein diacylglyceryl transferase [Candidatus Cloacimonadota bacterium]HPN41317.1 prolipoprotein diacylglyceryl transferase [Candidatus Cloacimonadota bacterium]